MPGRKETINDMLADEDFISELIKKFQNEIQQAELSAAHPAYQLENYLGQLSEGEFALLQEQFVRRKEHECQGRDGIPIAIPEGQQYDGIESEMGVDNTTFTSSHLNEGFQQSPEATSGTSSGPCSMELSDGGTSSEDESIANAISHCQMRLPSEGVDHYAPNMDTVPQRCQIGQCIPETRCKNCHHEMNNIPFIETLTQVYQDKVNVENVMWHFHECLRERKLKIKRLEEEVERLRSQCELLEKKSEADGIDFEKQIQELKDLSELDLKWNLQLVEQVDEKDKVLDCQMEEIKCLRKTSETLQGEKNCLLKEVETLREKASDHHKQLEYIKYHIDLDVEILQTAFQKMQSGILHQIQ